MNRLDAWWRARNPRERIMVGTMVAAVAAFVLWYGAIAPLRHARDAAQARYADAVLASNAIDAGLHVITSAARRGAAPTADAYRDAIVDSAGAANVALSRKTVEDDGRMTVGVDAVQTSALLSWLDDLGQRRGIFPESVRIDKRSGSLQAEVIFAPAPR